MANSLPPAWPRSVTVAASLLSFAVICAILYLGQVVLIPIALAGLVAFLLNPLVTRLQRRGFPRISATLGVVLAVAVVLGGIGYVVTEQVRVLLNNLPAYRENIREKVADVRGMMRGGALEKVQKTIDEVGKELEEESAKLDEEVLDGDEPEEEPEEEPVPVKVTEETAGWDISESIALGSALSVLATAGLVIVLVLFLLIQRDDLQSRLVAITGRSSLAITTKALDEAGSRISRYLLMQFVINVTFGAAAGFGLFVIGIPYALLWGLSAAVLRYIPYIGPWVAAVLPIAVSLVALPGWWPVLAVIGLFVVLELLSNNVMEPWLYGQSVGLSPVAIIIAAVFWTWLWGPVGLILSTPLTVCLTVLGRYIPAMAIVNRLFGERPESEPELALYQRLLARDEDEAAECVERYLSTHSPEEVFDHLLLPTIYLAERDRSRGHVSESEESAVLQSLQEIVEEIAELIKPETDITDEITSNERASPVLVIGFPVRDQGDELALEMLRSVVDPKTCELEILPHELLIAEKLAKIGEKRPACVCLVSVPPGEAVHMRRICKRIRLQCPETKVVAGRLGFKAMSERNRDLLRAAGADKVVATLDNLHRAIVPYVQFHQFVQPSQCEAERAPQPIH